MRFIVLTRGKVAMVDDADYSLVSRFNWCALKAKNTFYAVRRQGGKFIYLHRFLTNTTDSSTDVDHRDGNGLWNTRENLRACTHEQNSRNQRKQAGALSKYKGVASSYGIEKPWRAIIKANTRFTHLGRFRTEEEAARAYDAAALQHFGEFARVNFPA